GPPRERRPGRQGPRPVRPYLADHADHRTVRTPTVPASSGAGRPDGRGKVSSEVVSVTRGPTRRLRSGSVAGSVRGRPKAEVGSRPRSTRRSASVRGRRAG